jgi:site-specific DNA-methyltransferase (adenine-specific)
MKIIELKIEELKEYEHNAKEHPAEQVQQIANSIEEFGFNDPIAIDENNVIIEGHGRLLAAQLLKMEKIPTIKLIHLDEMQKKAYILAHNKLTMNSGFDLDLLKMELEFIDSSSLDIDITGFSLEDIEELGIGAVELPTDLADNVPDDVGKIVIKKGDLIELGASFEHKVLCGDSTDEQSFKKLLGEKKVDMVFTDPPYGVSYSSKNEFLNELDKGNRNQREIENDALSVEELEFFLIKVFKNIYNILADYSSYYITSPQGGELLMSMLTAMGEAKIPLRHMIIWNKNNHVLGRVDYMYKHEPILFGWKKRHKFYKKGNFTKSVWDIAKPLSSKLHPTMKPVGLVENAILNSTKGKMIVFDAFLGSGATLIACENNGRYCYGIEFEEHYVQVIIQRYIDYTSIDTIKINGKEVSWNDYKAT